MGVVADRKIPMRNADSGATRFAYGYRDTVFHRLLLPLSISESRLLKYLYTFS